MKKLLLIPFIILFVVGLILGGCAEPTPAPAPAPAPAPTPAPAPAPAPTPAPAPAPIKLLFGHIDPPEASFSPACTEWAEELGKRSNGRVQVEMSWASALGMMDEYYDLTVRGICDIGWAFFGFVAPGRFPMAEIIGLPWDLPPAPDSAKILHVLRQKGYFDKEMADTEIMFLTCGNSDYLFTVDKPITTLEEVKGLKLLGQTAPHTDRTKALGAVPVNLPFPEIYMSLDKRVIDGMTISWGPVLMTKTTELVKYVTYPGWGTVVNAVVMNKDTWNKLPADIQAIIDDMSFEYGVKAAGGYDAYCTEAERIFDENGGQRVRWTPEALDEIDALFVPIWEKWIAEREAKGLPARQALDDFYAEMKKLGIERPAYGYTPGG